MFFAEIVAADGDRARALALLGFAARHAAFDSEAEDERDRILNRIAPTSEEMSRASASGPTTDLERVVDELLAGHSAAPPAG
jgi:hypothetical protein